MSDLNDLEKRREHYNSLSEEELDAIWAKRAKLKLSEDEQNMLKYILRNLKGFKPSNPNIPMCKRCNLPVDNCACMNL
ncbi:MAG: hypothetical protein COA73_06610 [Candidatus Hydrogenedentota bacterium]|nr:MAG: hypothetical protein COA73_06610 [Candidatus Hydrogenedentota bacterium]